MDDIKIIDNFLTDEEFKKLSSDFDHLFSTHGAYEKLNNRVEKSKKKKVGKQFTFKTVNQII